MRFGWRSSLPFILSTGGDGQPDDDGDGGDASQDDPESLLSAGFGASRNIVSVSGGVVASGRSACRRFGCGRLFVELDLGDRVVDDQGSGAWVASWEDGLLRPRRCWWRGGRWRGNRFRRRSLRNVRRWQGRGGLCRRVLGPFLLGLFQSVIDEAHRRGEIMFSPRLAFAGP